MKKRRKTDMANLKEEESEIKKAEERIETEEKRIEALKREIEKEEKLIEKEESKIRKFFKISPRDKRFLFAFAGVTGVVFFWRGAWEVIDIIPIINNPFVSLFIGLFILTLSGFIYDKME